MTRALTMYVTVLAICLATSSSAEDLVPGKIVSVGQNTYMIRVTGGFPDLDVDARQAMKRAREYCAGMKQTVVVKGQAWDMGYGYTLTWSCLPPQHARTNH